MLNYLIPEAIYVIVLIYAISLLLKKQGSYFNSPCSQECPTTFEKAVRKTLHVSPSKHYVQASVTPYLPKVPPKQSS